MTPYEFKSARKKHKWTQQEVATSLGVSQTYVALFERGKRKFPVQLARKAVTLLGMSPWALPVREKPLMNAQRLPEQLASLGYPGFSYLRCARKRNPAEVLLAALSQVNLETRVAEALPWLLLQYAEMNETNKLWLLEQARVHNLTNRLGFVVTLAKEVLSRKEETTSSRYLALTSLEEHLNTSRLAQEDTLCQASLSQNEREWLRQTRSETAARWNLLTGWQPEHLQYAAS